MFTLFGTIVTWRANQQSIIDFSTTKPKYITLVKGLKEAMWLKCMIGELGISQGCVKIHCNRHSATYLVNDQVYHERKIHIDIWLHFFRDMVESKEIVVEKVTSKDNPLICLVNHYRDQDSSISWIWSSLLMGRWRVEREATWWMNK